MHDIVQCDANNDSKTHIGLGEGSSVILRRGISLVKNILSPASIDYSNRSSLYIILICPAFQITYIQSTYKFHYKLREKEHFIPFEIVDNVSSLLILT